MPRQGYIQEKKQRYQEDKQSIMAKTSVNAGAACRKIVSDAEAGKFAPVYLLMGDEPYYLDIACKAIIDNAMDDSDRDLNEEIYFGADVNAEMITASARRFSMTGDRILVAVKDAQLMKNLELMSVYCENPLDSTVLVLLMRGASADKRKALYKQVLKNGVVLESNAMRDYEMPGWISEYFSSKGLSADPDAAALLAEYAGTDLGRIAVEVDKMTKNLPEGATRITAADVENNVGISREHSIFELTKELSARNAPKALRVAYRIGQGAKFAMPMAVSALYTHFLRILKYAALKEKNPRPSKEETAAALAGVNPFFWKEYDMAVRNYPVRKAMGVMSLLCEYDFKAKGGETGEASPGDLLVELTNKILTI